MRAPTTSTRNRHVMQQNGTQTLTADQSSLLPDRSSMERPEWSDWKWQMKNRIRSVGELRGWIRPVPEELDGIARTRDLFRWRITPYYASLMDPGDPRCPIRRQVVPHADEMEDDVDLLDLDPLEEQAHSPVKNLIHNYRDRVAFCVTTECAVYCRYCLRKRMVGDGTQALNREELQEAIDYLAAHPEIRDVLLTGGDPLSLNDENLGWIIGRLREIPHIDIIRIGTRYPVLNPYRITDELCRLLADNHPVWLNTHFNHAKELTEDARAALDRLSRSGVPLGNQTVLLKGINDDAETLRELFHKLVTFRVRPYYLYQAQLIGGTRHFRTTIERGTDGAAARATGRVCDPPLCAGHAARKGTPDPQRVPGTRGGLCGRAGLWRRDLAGIQSVRRLIAHRLLPLTPVFE
ncbi:MAG: KamA family radical SAM protein [Bacteroidota bacterium]